MQESHAESASSRVSCPACIPCISPRTRISPRVHPVHIAPHTNTALQRQSNAPILPINIVRFDIRRQSSVLLSSSFFHTISTCGNNNMTHACSRRISILPPNIETNCSMRPKSAAPSQKRSYRCRRTLHCTVNLCKKQKESMPLIRLHHPSREMSTDAEWIDLLRKKQDIEKRARAALNRGGILIQPSP